MQRLVVSRVSHTYDRQIIMYDVVKRRTDCVAGQRQ